MKQETLKTLEKLLIGLVVMDFKKEAEEKIKTCLKEVKEAINYNRCCKSDSELLVLFADWLQYNGKWSTTEQQVKDFLKEQQEQN